MLAKNVLGIHKNQLDTPCLVIDIDLLLYNLNFMQQHGNQHNIHIRPHCKTHKCSTLAKLQLKYGAIGVCVTKLSEAFVLAQQGISSILITSPIVTADKIMQLIELLQLAPDLMVVIDNEDNCKALNDAALLAHLTLNVLIDVDAGIGRTGITPEKALMLAQKAHQSPGLKLVGIQCYAGHIQHLASYEQRYQRSLEVMTMASVLVKRFKEEHLPCPILSGGGTGTYDIDYLASEVTEIQPGSYAVMDVDYTTIHTKEHTQFTTFKPAMTLLTTVISANHTTHVTVDAGTKALYVDAHQPQILNHLQLTYDWAGFGDEHGKITGKTLPKLGDVLELIVPHCDPTINLHDRFYITQHDHVIDVWEIDLRGKCQ